MNLRTLTPLGWAAVAILCLSLLILAQCAMERDAKRRTEAAWARANDAARITDTAAREAAADQRLADTLRTLQTEKELTDALKDLPDARPSDRRIALACERLRRQGDDTASIPACR